MKRKIVKIILVCDCYESKINVKSCNEYIDENEKYSKENVNYEVFY